ncbi:hypothetical protein ULMS_14560 [Patiriisocius marinistellae]|uniref:Secretion system C-terminal sorting domain-containing protein n=1 Tax=Patiriisocius marinistellae TaxID=2494560 RepID=A0A5J4FXA4_9FLAO|nr:endonuclease [Patiriisocius marinistellae]GEQ85948.1 hypothetical protein ULMS_14560 [Patiriisocius marinistellae]
MKKITLLFAIIFTTIASAQQAYYNDVDLTLTGQALYQELQQKININNNSFTYGDIRDSVKFTDEDTENSNNVILIYGYDDSSCTTQRSRDKDDFGGTTCEYNREHTFARSNANPSMGNVNNGTTGIGADPHNLRSSDQQMNNNRGSKKFADGSGNAGNVGSGNWYPGDEWKGDVARIMMYMYTRYGNQCLPSLNGVGATQSGNDMLQVYLQWNIEDPVSDFEDQRNPYLETNYGNRNPFIDNPYLATLIWGGEAAEDRWDLFSIEDNILSKITIAPNPATNTVSIYNTNTTESITAMIYTVTGKRVATLEVNQANEIDVSSLSSGLYLLQLSSRNTNIIKKLIIK